MTMLSWGLDTQLRSLSLKNGCERAGTPLPPSPSFPARPSVKIRGSVPDRFIPRRRPDSDGFSLFEQRQVTKAGSFFLGTVTEARFRER